MSGPGYPKPDGAPMNLCTKHPDDPWCECQAKNPDLVPDWIIDGLIANSAEHDGLIANSPEGEEQDEK